MDLMKKAQAQLNTPPKKPCKNTKPVCSMIDGNGVVHWIWADNYARFCLEDMAHKLAKFEAAEAARNGSTN